MNEFDLIREYFTWSIKDPSVVLGVGYDAALFSLEQGYQLVATTDTLTESIVEIANLHCDGRVISFLEGGYDLLALSEGTKAHLKGLNEN